MISARLLNSEALLNSYFFISQIQYVPGENLDIAFRLIHRERGTRLVVVNLAAIVTVNLERRSVTTPLVLTAVPIDALDRSMWRVSLTAAETLDLAGSNIQITLDALGDGTDLSITVIPNSLARTTLSGDC